MTPAAHSPAQAVKRMKVPETLRFRDFFMPVDIYTCRNKAYN